jgi:hypothetical protein
VRREERGRKRGRGEKEREKREEGEEGGKRREGEEREGEKREGEERGWGLTLSTVTSSCVLLHDGKRNALLSLSLSPFLVLSKTY